MYLRILAQIISFTLKVVILYFNILREKPMNIELGRIRITLPNSKRELFNIENLTIHQGERILISGPSGSGKTTLLHLIAGLFNPTEGWIKYDNQPISQFSDSQRSFFRRQNLSLIFQKLNLIEHLTSIENVKLGVYEKLIDQEKTQKAIDTLNKLNLKNYHHTQCSLMSLGEQQRVAVARSLVSSASIILADEPTSSLDDNNTNLVMNALIKFSENKTLITVSHDHRIHSHFTKEYNISQWVSHDLI